MKQSKIVPVYKAGEKDNPGNYRPVSILPSISKIFEKLILNQLLTYFNTNNLLHKHQFGFTKGRSTTDAGVKLTEFIIKAWEDHHDAVGVFCDLSKAFDCVSHQTLISKLSFYGISSQALNMISSYLCDRVQTVEIDGSKSQGSLISIGVPQGSILGPFLFLIYANDLPFMLQKHINTEIVLFADDTSILFKIKRGIKDYAEINHTLDCLCNWFDANNLALNPSKTKCMRFSLPNVRNSFVDIKLKDKVIEPVKSTVFLGITLDTKLQWGLHVDTLTGRLSSAAHAVRQIRQLTDVMTARLVYFGYFHSVMSYGILLWGSVADTYLESVFVLQKRAIRAIYNLGPRVSLRELFKTINILTVPSLYIYECIMHARKNLTFLRKKADVQTTHLETRHRQQLLTPKCRLEKTSTCFIGNSIRFYNVIPKQLLGLSETKFKKAIKQYLLNKAYYEVENFIKDKKHWNKYISKSLLTDIVDRVTF